MTDVCPANFKGRLSGHSPFHFDDSFDYVAGPLTGQGPWLATGLASLTVEFPNFAQSPNDNTSYSNKAPLVGAPAWDAAWELEVELTCFLDDGTGTGQVIIALLSGILNIGLTINCNHTGSDCTASAFGGAVTASMPFDFAGPQVIKLVNHGNGTAEIFYNGASYGGGAVSPGADVPDFILIQDKRNTGDFQGFSRVRFAYL